MTDIELTRALERGEIASQNFHHASHLHVAWVYLSESSSVKQAADKMRNTLRAFASAAGKLEKYHETITLFGCTCSLQRVPERVAAAWRKSFMPIRACWKRIFHSLIIRESGFSARPRGLHGWSRI